MSACLYFLFPQLNFLTYQVIQDYEGSKDFLFL